jgi:uncharacterized delta-60 repeat protein
MKKKVWIVLGSILGVTLLIPLEGGRSFAPQEKWVARYNGPARGSDVATAVAVDGSGNVYVTGGSKGSGTDYDYATIKYNANGKQLWVKRYDGPAHGWDYAQAIAVDGSGNVHVTGYVTVSSTDRDYSTIKYNANGKQLWVARYEGPGKGYDYARAIAVDGSGNVYVTGYVTVSSTDYDYATIKYDANGKQLWVKRYNGPANGFDDAQAIAVDGSDNVYVTGGSEGSGTGGDHATIKYNTNGKQLWTQRYSGSGNRKDNAYAIAVDGSGNVYITGYVTVSSVNYDYATIKYNANGKQIWAKKYNGPANGFDDAYAVAVDGSGNTYVTGVSTGSGTGLDYATVKYNTNGKQLWAQRYNGPGNMDDTAKAIAVDASGTIYVTGMSEGSGTDLDYGTIMYSTDGKQLWIKRYNGAYNGNDSARAIAVDGSGNVYVTGSSKGSGKDWSGDYATIKY